MLTRRQLVVTGVASATALVLALLWLNWVAQGLVLRAMVLLTLGAR